MGAVCYTAQYCQLTDNVSPNVDKSLSLSSYFMAKDPKLFYRHVLNSLFSRDFSEIRKSNKAGAVSGGGTSLVDCLVKGLGIGSPRTLPPTEWQITDSFRAVTWAQLMK